MTAPTKTEMSIDELVEKLGTDEISADHVRGGLEYVHGRAAELREKANGEGLTREENAEAKQLAEQWGSLAAARDTMAAEQQAASDALGAIPDSLDAPEEGESEDEETEGEDERQSGQPADPGDPPPAAEGGAVAASGKATKATSKTVTVPRPQPGDITAAAAQHTGQAVKPGPSYSLVAASGAPKKGQGETLSDEAFIAELMDAHAEARGVGSGEKVKVATIRASASEERHLRAGQSIENSRKMDAATAPAAITAAGGVCAPYVIDYSVDVIGVTDRPIKDSLPGFTVDRGGIQYRRKVDGGSATMAGASGVWSLADDAAVGTGSPPAAKAILKVQCAGVVSDEVAAVTLGLQFSNITSRFDPEYTAAMVQAANVQHSRMAENRLLKGMIDRCTNQFTSASTLGAVRDVLAGIDHTVAYYRSRHRLNDRIPLRMYAPQWLMNIFRTDLLRSMPVGGGSLADTLAITDATIATFFSNRNVNITWHLDGNASAISASGTGGTQIYASAAQQYAAQGNQAVPSYPDQADMVLFVEGDWTFLDGGTLDVGVVRDKSLVQSNESIQFQESFEGLAFKGVESVRYTPTIQALGLSQGTVATAFTD